MIMPRKKRIAVRISITLIILVLLAGGIVLYMTTNMFKSNKVLFSKYTMQLLDNLGEIFNEEHMVEVEDMLNNHKLTSDTIATVNYSENGNSSNPINDIQIEILGEQEKLADYDYKNITLKQDDNTLFGAEYIKDGTISGIRLDGIRQYLSTNINNQDDNEINAIYELANTDVDHLIGLTSEESTSLKDKYLKIIMAYLENANFSRRKGVPVEINEIQYDVNIYSVTLTKEQFNNIYVEILKNLQQETIFLSKLENIDNKINQYDEFMQNGQTSNLKQEFIDSIGKTIEDIQNSNIGNDERTISVFESNGVAISL